VLFLLCKDRNSFHGSQKLEPEGFSIELEVDGLFFFFRDVMRGGDCVLTVGVEGSSRIGVGAGREGGEYEPATGGGDGNLE
jgi:hypothetical protein